MHNLYEILLVNEQNREHPVLGAVLYLHCPAAAGWWRAGAGLPEKQPYDVVSHALELYAQKDMTLKRAMESFGLLSLFELVKKYLGDVESYRRFLPNVLAPELLPSFAGVGMDVTQRAGNKRVFDEYFGGDWRNTLEFARIWACVLQDWQRVIAPEMDSEIRLEKKHLLFRIADTDSAIRLPAWVWLKNKGRRPCVGFVSSGGRQDQLLCYMGQFSAPEENHAWSIMPQICILDPQTGAVESFQYLVEKKLMTGLLSSLGRLAKTGPYPPLEALSGSGKCTACIFRIYCFEENGLLSESVIRILEPARLPPLRRDSRVG